MSGDQIPDDWPRRAYSTRIRAMPHHWHVQVSGQGPDLLLLHGAGASAHSWRGLAPLLTGYRVIAPDLPGHGFTRTAERARLNLDAMADDLTLLCQGQGWKPAAIIGHSAGGVLALRMAELLPRPPLALAGINAALGPFEGFAGWLFPKLARLMAVSPFMPHLLSGLASNRKKVESVLASTGSKLAPADVDLYRRLLAMPQHLDGTLNMMANWQLDPILARLPQTAVPVLLLTSSGDLAVPPAVSRNAATRLPRVECAELPGYGHLVHEEAPEAVATLLLPWLSRHIASGSSRVVAR
ncbi:MAG: alpha/beta fold hydrolase [Gemmobacter sp.]|nr:alpha/beta fold hydrolase [Gemmobacter sp.]